MAFEDTYVKSNIKDDSFVLEVKDILTTSNNRMNIVLDKFKKNQNLINELNTRSPRGKTIQEQLFRIFYPERSPNTNLYNFISFTRGYNCEYILGDFDYKEEIQKIINSDTTGKTYNQTVKRNFTLWEEILDKTTNIKLTNSAALIYCYMNDITDITCENGNQYRWKEYLTEQQKENGVSKLGFCGHPSKCKCARDSVSASCKKSKSLLSKEEKEAANDKRKATVLTKSGGKFSNNINSPNGKRINQERKVKRFADLIEYCNKNKLVLNHTEEEYYKAREINNKLKYTCKECNSDFYYKANARMNCITCRICNPAENKPVSNEEIDLRHFIVSLLDKGEHYTHSNQYVISPYELDIVLNDRNIAIEYNGLYWHSHKMNQEDKHYHSIKLTLCWRKSFRLFSVYSDDWCNNRTIVENKIKSMLLSINLETTVIKEIDKNIENDFVKDFQFTLQNTDYCLGYYNNDELIATLSFHEGKMVYFNSKYNNSNILKSLISFYNKDILVSKIDLNYDDWKKYKDVGFTMIKRIAYEKYYITDNYHHKQKDIVKNEKINDVLYDCGNILCEYKKVVEK